MNENLNKIETSGVDINSTFAWDSGLGAITANWLATYIDEWKQTSDTGVEDDRTGKIACDVCDFAGYPEWKSTLSLALSRDSWNVTLVWRYIDEMEIDDQIGFDEFTDKADEVNYFDFYGSYNWDNLELSVGVENIGDEEPPFIPSISNNTNGMYDYLGTFYSARLRYSL